MNKPTPAIDENGEFVVATQRDGSKAILYTLDNGRGQIVGDSRWWWLDGETICDRHPECSLADLPAVRATVERARKARDAIRTAAGITFARNQNFYGGVPGQVEKAPAPARPSFAEALYKIIDNAPPEHNSLAPVTWGGLIAIIKRARRASEGE